MSEVKEFIKKKMTELEVPSWSVAVVREGNTTFVRSDNTTPENRFPICSTTKILTAATAIKVLDQNSISLNAGSFGTYFTVISEKNTAIISLFNHPAGYGLTPYSIFNFLYEGESGRSKPPTRDGNITDFVGKYRSVDGREVVIESLDANFLQIQIEDKGKKLKRLTDRVYKTEQETISVGLCAKRQPDFITVNEYPIGFVSAIPFKKSAGK